MTKEEIIALISKTIAGQGNQVDISGQLPAILAGIVGLIPEAPTPYVLPVATSEVLGGVKVGSGLAATEEGVLSATNTPLVVEIVGITDGMNEESYFVLKSGSTISLDDIKSAIQANRLVIAKYEKDETWDSASFELANSGVAYLQLIGTRLGIVICSDSSYPLSSGAFELRAE